MSVCIFMLYLYFTRMEAIEIMDHFFFCFPAEQVRTSSSSDFHIH